MEYLKLLETFTKEPITIVENPVKTIYFIVYDDEKTNVSYGFITPEQTLQSGLPNIFQTEKKEEFVSKLSFDFNLEYKE